MSRYRFPILVRLGLIGVVATAASVHDQSWAASTPVTVENPTSIAKDIAKAEGIETPITITFSCSISAGFSSCASLSQSGSYTVPANKRLVMESVSYQVMSAPYYPPIALTNVEIVVNYYGLYFLPLPAHLDTDPENQTLLFRAYAKAGDIIYAAFSATTMGRPITGTMTLSGQLVDVP